LRIVEPLDTLRPLPGDGRVPFGASTLMRESHTSKRALLASLLIGLATLLLFCVVHGPSFGARALFVAPLPLLLLPVAFRAPKAASSWRPVVPWLLGAALLAALYLPGMFWDLRHGQIWHPDLPKLVTMAERLEREPLPDLPDLRYPTLFPWCVAATRRALVATLGVAPQPGTLLEAGGLLALLMTLGSLAGAAMRSAARHGRSRVTVALSVGFVALCPGLLVATHYGMTDLPLTAAATALLGELLALVDDTLGGDPARPRPSTGAILGRFARAGLLLSIACAMKYTGALLGVWLLATTLYLAYRRALPFGLLGGGLAIALLASLSSYPLLVPSVLTHFGKVLDALQYEQLAARSLFYGLFLKERHAFALRMQFTLGLPLLLTALFGFFSLLRRLRARAAGAGTQSLLAAFVLLPLLYLATVTRVWFWYLLPLLPPLGLLVAIELEPFLVAGPLSPRARWVAAGVLAASAYLYALVFVLPYAGGSTRLVAARWFSEETPAGSTVGLVEGGWKEVRVDARRLRPAAMRPDWVVMTRQMEALHRAFATNTEPERFVTWKGRKQSLTWFPGNPPSAETSRLLSQLGEGQGYELAHVIERPPRLGPWSLEALAPYEYLEFVTPTYLVFRKKP
jgi:4-amino-4-deoxy-L-arabinose transferase-like glycosyltransferase